MLQKQKEKNDKFHKEKEKALQAQPKKRRSTHASPKLPLSVLDDRCPSFRPGLLSEFQTRCLYYPSIEEYPKVLPSKLLAAHVKCQREKPKVQRLYKMNKAKWYATGLLYGVFEDPSLLETDFSSIFNDFLERLVDFACSIWEEAKLLRPDGPLKHEQEFLRQQCRNVTDGLLRYARDREQEFLRPPPVDPVYKASINKAWKRLDQLLTSDLSSAAYVLHLAWTASGYNILALPAQVADHGAWVAATNIIETVKLQYPVVSYADLYQLAGVISVKVLGGPDILFFPGRQDKLEPPIEKHGEAVPYRVEADAKLKGVFELEALGLGHQDIVALCGCRCLVSHHLASGKIKPGAKRKRVEVRSTQTPAFTNQYFKDLLLGEHPPLTEPPYREHVELFARDEDAFFHAYRSVHYWLSNLGLAAQREEEKEELVTSSHRKTYSSHGRQAESFLPPTKKRVTRRRLRARRKWAALAENQASGSSDES